MTVFEQSEPLTPPNLPDAFEVRLQGEPTLGGWGDMGPVEAGSEEDALFRSWQGMLEAETNSEFSEFEPQYYSSQVVAGMNYEVKFYVGDGQWLVAEVYVDFSQNAELTSLEVYQENSQAVYLLNEMRSFVNVVEAFESRDEDLILTAISDRKDEIRFSLDERPEHREAAKAEL